MNVLPRRILWGALLLFGGAGILSALDFGGAGGGGEGSSFSPFTGLKIRGELSAELLGYTGEFQRSSISTAKLGDIASGKLNFSASGAYAAGVLNLKFAPVFDGSVSPLAIDEAYLRFYLGDFQLEGGVRKLTWGKADSFGPLDVVNPLDYSDLSSLSDQQGRKIARPMLHLTWGPGSFTKLEAVFEPSFQGHRFAAKGRWAPQEILELGSSLESMINAIPLPVRPEVPSLDALYYDTSVLKYAQGGLRFTTTLGQADLGLQYFCGNLFRPAVNFSLLPGYSPGVKIADYNRYHQIGMDYAQVLGGFNVRAEAAANITSDIHGDDGEVCNPFLGWSLGFDRDILWQVNLNLQGTGTVRLLHDRLGSDPLADTEAGKDMTSTRIILLLSKKFFRDELEIKTLGLWGIEDQDLYIIPALVWTRDDLSLEFSGGIFAGKETGELGQYRDNHFVKFLMTYRF